MKMFLTIIVIIGITSTIYCTKPKDQQPEQPCIQKIGTKTILTKACLQTKCADECKRHGFDFDPRMVKDFDLPPDTMEQEASTLYVCPCAMKP